jgi:hypothetical protein
VLPFDGRVQAGDAAVVADDGRAPGSRVDVDGDGAAVRAEYVAEHVDGGGQQGRQVPALEREDAQPGDGLLLVEPALHLVLRDLPIGDVDARGEDLGDGARGVAERYEGHVEIAADPGPDLDVELAADGLAGGGAPHHLERTRARLPRVRQPRRLVDAPPDGVAPGDTAGDQRGLIDVQHDAVGRIDRDERHQAVDDVAQAGLPGGDDGAIVRVADHAVRFARHRQ